MSRVAEHFNVIAGDYDFYKRKNWYYYSNLKKLYQSLIPSHSAVLEIGCGTGDLLAGLNAVYGLGVDISPEMINIAKSKHKDNKNIEFLTGDIEGLQDLTAGRKFDYVFLADVIEHLENPETALCNISKIVHPGAVMIISMANPSWEAILMIAEKFKLKMPEGPHHRITAARLEKILRDNNFTILQSGCRLLLPVYVPFVSDFVNRYFLSIPFFKSLGVVMFWVCKKNDINQV